MVVAYSSLGGKKMKRFVLLLVTVLIVTLGSLSAEERGAFGGFGYSGAVVLWHSDMSGLNSALQSAGYQPLSQFDYAYGGGGGAIINNFYIGGWGYGDVIKLQSDNSTNSNYVKKTYGGGGFDFGYLLLGNDRLIVIPTAGFQWGGNIVEIYNATPTSTTFSGLLANPGNMTTVESNDYSLSLSLQTGIMFGQVGIYTRIGYLFTPVETWEISGYSGNLTGAPSTGIHSVFVSAGVVFGGREKSMHYRMDERKE